MNIFTLSIYFNYLCLKSLFLHGAGKEKRQKKNASIKQKSLKYIIVKAILVVKKQQKIKTEPIYLINVLGIVVHDSSRQVHLKKCIINFHQTAITIGFVVSHGADRRPGFLSPFDFLSPFTFVSTNIM